MKTKIIVSNVRFPEDEWLQVKTVATARGMSVNQYMRYLSSMDTVRNITGITKKTKKSSVSGYKAMEKFINRKISGNPMGASEEDKVIYGIE